MVQVKGIVGLQWGDEGKGKLVHFLSSSYDCVARYNGGNNAGHTIVTEDTSVIFHLLPSGMIHPQTIGIIGTGTVINPAILIKELDWLHSHHYTTHDRLFISDRAHLILPYHQLWDELLEKSRSAKIGTTKRGIGPSYTDKFARDGIRLGEFYHVETFRIMLESKFHEYANKIQKCFDTKPDWDIPHLVEEYVQYAKTLQSYVTDTSSLLREQFRLGKSILLEGAQGVMLDIDYGTYPFVSSSSSIISGACTGLGITPRMIQETMGVFKAYTTRVGEGPFPTELFTDEGKILLTQGNEYGSTTGRPRRCGWLDLPALRYAVALNDIDQLALMKLDVLDHFDEIQVCTSYHPENLALKDYPATLSAFNKLKPVYAKLPGWKTSTRNCTSFEDLPLQAKKYIEFIEEDLQKPVNLISVGPDRKETIEK